MLPVMMQPTSNGTPQATGHIQQPSTSIPTHPVVLLPPSAAASLQQPQQQQQQPAQPVVTGQPIQQHCPPGLMSHPHPPIALQQPVIQTSGAFGEATATVLPSTQIIQQQQPSATQQIGSLPADVMLQTMPPIQSHVQQPGPHLMQQQQPTLVQQQQPSQQHYVNSGNLTMPTAVMSVATSMQPSVQLIMTAPTTVTSAVVSSSSNSVDQSSMPALPHAASLISKSQSVIDEGHAGSEDHAR